MLEKSTYYPGQKSKEEVIMFIRRHKIAYVKWVFILFVMFLVPAVFLPILISNGSVVFTDSNKYWYLIVSSAYAMTILAVFLTSWIDFYLDVTIITKEHLINIRQDDLFTRSVAEQSLLRVQDVSARMEGFWQTFFRFGTVYVETAGEQPNFRMVNIPNPHVVASTIMQIHEELIEEHELGEEITNGIGMDLIKPIKNKSKIDNESQKTASRYRNQAVEIEPSGEEKIITIQKPQPGTETKEAKDNAQKIEMIDNLLEKKKKAETEQFQIEKSWIAQEPKYKVESMKKNKKEAKKSGEIDKTKPKDKQIIDQDKPVFSKTSNNEVEGEIKEGEEVKF